MEELESSEELEYLKRKKFLKRIKIAAFVILLLAAGTGYCLHKTETEYAQSSYHYIERIDSAETDITMVGGGPEGMPCDTMYVHIEGSVLAGEITIAVYDRLESETEWTSDNALVWEEKEGSHLIFSETYLAGDSIDQWLEVHRGQHRITCGYSVVVTYPTNTDVEAEIVYGDSRVYYGWQNLLSSSKFSWLRSLLHIDETPWIN